MEQDSLVRIQSWFNENITSEQTSVNNDRPTRRRDPIESAQRLLVPPKSLEEMIGKQIGDPIVISTAPIAKEEPIVETQPYVPEELPVEPTMVDDGTRTFGVDFKQTEFLPEGFDYDYKRAEQAGIKPEIDPTDGLPHWGSVAPTTKGEQEKYNLPKDSYILLKGKQHETWDKAVAAEEERGFEIQKHGDRYFSVPKEKTTQEVPPSKPPVDVSKKDLYKMEEYDRALVKSVYDDLLQYEGEEGDKTGTAKTGVRGMTNTTRDFVMKKFPERFEGLDINNKKDRIKIDIIAGNTYIEMLHLDFANKTPGYADLDFRIQNDLLVESYNLPALRNFPRLKEAIKNYDGTRSAETQIFFHLLDTAKINGKGASGIALRRADIYNKHSDEPIKYVTIDKEGTITYSTIDNKVILSVPTKGLNETSLTGTYDVITGKRYSEVPNKSN